MISVFGGVLAVHNRLHELDEMAVAVLLARIAGMLVLLAQRLHEAHGRQAVLRSLEKVLLVAQMRLAPFRPAIFSK